MNNIMPIEQVESKILLIRGQKVILDRDLAELYGVETRVLKQAVRRNIQRFPEDFMFKLNQEEFNDLRSQIVMSSSGWGGLRYAPMAFTEQGVAMISSVINSEKSIAINIMIIRAFVRMRELISNNVELAHKISELERRLDTHDEIIVDIVNTVKSLLESKVNNKKIIGFKQN